MDALNAPATRQRPGAWSHLDERRDMPKSICIESTGTRQPSGYYKVRRAGRDWYAHRWAWTQTNGPIPDGLHVCHTCDDRSCVNVSHLWLGTNAENTADKVAKGRQARGPQMRNPKRGEQNGRAKVDEATVRFIRDHADWSSRDLAAMFGITPGIVRRIASRRSWLHVA